MRILVLGGDGFCGWPTSLYLSDRGHQVTIVDNLSRRKIDIELEVESLTPIRPIGERLRVWQEVTGREIGFVNTDIATEYDRLVDVLLTTRPDAIVHFAEQRAAPYSMRTPATKRYTVDNNIRATHNLLSALVETGIDAALVHLGTMGVYGYGWSGSSPIPEGYLTVKVSTPDGELEREILHPANPGSVYHLTKTLDQLLFSFYAKNDGLRITDLPNPRREADENELIVCNDRFLALGLEPTKLSDGLLEEGTEIARRYGDRVDPSKIIARSVWRKGMATAEDLITSR
jgi:UDP-sulfoquinovose synthase